jgi:hypothetical protein
MVGPPGVGDRFYKLRHRRDHSAHGKSEFPQQGEGAGSLQGLPRDFRAEGRTAVWTLRLDQITDQRAFRGSSSGNDSDSRAAALQELGLSVRRVRRQNARSSPALRIRCWSGRSTADPLPSSMPRPVVGGREQGSGGQTGRGSSRRSSGERRAVTTPRGQAPALEATW